MNTIKLNKKVVVSDPCYSIPTWCQAVIDNVKPGTYYTTVKKHDAGNWGNRCSMIYAIHEDYIDHPNLIKRWEKTNYDIGVDSGQCGIFDGHEIHRKNRLLIRLLHPLLLLLRT